jgi:hypothetical protein
MFYFIAYDTAEFIFNHIFNGALEQVNDIVNEIPMECYIDVCYCCRTLGCRQVWSTICYVYLLKI